MTQTRDWTEPQAKVALEDACRACNRVGGLDPAHLWPRSLGGNEDPDNIVPLCRDCHWAFDSGRYDLGRDLTLREKQKVVELAEISGSRDGLDAAHRRLFPSAHKTG